MPKKILIVEDDHFLSDLYRSVLEGEGYLVSQAFDGLEGIANASKELPDLILLDLVLPELSGLEVLKKIKSSPNGKSLKVVILSNIKDEEIIASATQMGAEGYIVKRTISPNQIADEVKRYLEVA